MQLGDRVRRGATGEEGVVISTDGDFLDVTFHSGRQFVHRNELIPVEREPDELLTGGVLGRGLPYALRLQALFLKHAYKYDRISGLSNARIEPELHQVYIAHQVTQKLRPRMLLADEVGLGKTIEAALIIKELRARELLNRVLIVCPASLQYQWQQELRSKFNEDFDIIDGSGVKFLGLGGVNPWTKRDNVICSIPFASNPKHADRIVEAGWDLVVFDEAHRVRRYRQSAKKVTTTRAYRLADELKEIVNGLLLLTATPMQLHPYELYSLIELVEPGLLATFAEYEAKRKTLPELNEVMKLLKGWGTLTSAERTQAKHKHEKLLGQLAVPKESLESALSDLARREELMDALVKKHPLSGVLVRNRKAELGGFSYRAAHRVPVELATEELDLYRDVTAYIRQGYDRAQADKNLAVGFLMVTYQKMQTSSSHAIRESFKKRAQKLRIQLRDLEGSSKRTLTQQRADELRDVAEVSDVLDELMDASIAEEDLVKSEIQRLQELVDRLGQVHDSKASKLLELVDGLQKSEPGEKLLVFTQFIDTQEFLAFALEQAGYKVARFNGKMSLDEKEEQVRRFKDAAQIMVSTEAGGEGRNFQFCHRMVNYDLPWNPMKVEQRIGRLDRIGQTRPVVIYNLVCRDTVEERVVTVLEDRIRLFEESVGSLDPILGEVEKEIEALVMEKTAESEAFESYEKDIEKRVREARERERTLSDFVLDRASLRSDQAQELLNQSPLARWTDLQGFIEQALDFHGGTLKKHADGGEVISLSPKLAAKLKSGHAVVRGTFVPDIARRMEELPFFAFGHNLIDRLIDHTVLTEPNSTGARRIRTHRGELAVELFYELVSVGVRPEGKVVRHVVNEDLSVKSELIKQIPPLGEAVTIDVPRWVSAAVKASRTLFAKEQAEYLNEIRRAHEGYRNEELARNERIFRYRELRLKRLVEEQESWLEEKERTGSERERRILPARRGQLLKRKEELERLRFDHEESMDEIRSREAGASARILAAGLVVGA